MLQVRCDPNSPYSPDKKNDGSFKKWLVSRGFVMGPVYDHNKCQADRSLNGV